MENAMELDQKITIQDRLNQHPSLFRYLLLDPLKTISHLNPLHMDNLQQSLGKEAIYPVLRRDLAYSPEHCPQLILLASPGEHCEFSWLADSESYARNEALQEKRYFSAWLTSAQEPKQLAASLAKQCNQIITDVFLPFFEPLCFELLKVKSPEDGLAGRIWPVSQWWFMTVSGNIAFQAGKNVGEKSWLNWGIEMDLQDFRSIRKLLWSWHEAEAGLPFHAAMQAEEAWENTLDTGLKDTDDRNYWALNYLTMRVDIGQHPAVRVLIQQAIDNPSQRISALLQTLSDEVWLELESQTIAEPSMDGINHYGA